LAKLDDLIEQTKISMELEEVARNPILAENSQGEGLEHYLCRLVRPGKRLDVYLSVRAENHPLTLFDVLLMLAIDASGCGMIGGLEKYREIWTNIFDGTGNKPKEIEFFWEELEGRCLQAERVREFLGSSAYESLLDLFGIEEDDQGLPRSSPFTL
jgi:hypothetical protein